MKRDEGEERYIHYFETEAGMGRALPWSAAEEQRLAGIVAAGYDPADFHARFAWQAARNALVEQQHTYFYGWACHIVS